MVSENDERRRRMFSGILGIGGLIGGIITVIVGIILLVWPRFIAAIIGIYLILLGIVAVLSSV